GDSQDVYAFARTGEEETLVVVLNNGAHPYELDLDLGSFFPADAPLKDVWAGREARVSQGRAVGATVPARSGVVLTT
ncbi:MAG: alpha-glucosidase C-terminal domain-containing protein, partial [Anaerolineae bacterium]|nr:alpha-glucosidase C-terminal domain-containing protein [Anaerolineae bacterium]